MTTTLGPQLSSKQSSLKKPSPEQPSPDQPSSKQPTLTQASQKSRFTFPTDFMGPNIIVHPGQDKASSAETIGSLIEYIIKNDPNFYLFSPDETTSNKLDAAYHATSRAWALPRESWDLAESENGHIIELLSENVLFSVMAGHLLGSHKRAMMTSYEAFFEIIAAQVVQHLKFLKQSENVSWRENAPAANLLSTSTCWRQDHNGFTHQSPALISTLLSHPSNHANCIFPVDSIAASAAMEFMMNSENVVNLTTFNKTEEPIWIDKNHAAFQYEYGASIYGFASDNNPDYVITAAGDIATREAIRAINILRQDLPDRHFRFVGINALSYRAIGTTEKKMPQEVFDDYFTTDKPIIANFHGYPDDLKNILANYTSSSRISAHGFEEEGSTTTPFEMLAMNHASRYDLAADVARHEGRDDLVTKYMGIIDVNTQHARDHGEDLQNMI